VPNVQVVDVVSPLVVPLAFFVPPDRDSSVRPEVLGRNIYMHKYAPKAHQHEPMFFMAWQNALAEQEIGLLMIINASRPSTGNPPGRTSPRPNKYPTLLAT
jgi:hypothetical protein